MEPLGQEDGQDEGETEQAAHNLTEKGKKLDLIQQLLASYAGETNAGHSSMLQNIPPAQLDISAASSAAAAGDANEEPTTVSTTGSLSEVDDEDTPGPVDNVPPEVEATFGGEECNLLLGLNVSAPTTG